MFWRNDVCFGNIITINGWDVITTTTNITTTIIIHLMDRTIKNKIKQQTLNTRLS